MTFDNAVKCARALGTGQIYQTSRMWHIRGIRTEFSFFDKRAKDWQPCQPAARAIADEVEAVMSMLPSMQVRKEIA